MITVSININSQPIYTRSAVNTGERHKITNHVKYALDTGQIILHHPEDGAVVLAKKMLDTIQEYSNN